MDAPPSSEDLAAYIKISEYLCSIGLSAPQIFNADISTGFAVIEDFGEATYTQLLNSGADTYKLYELAVDALRLLHQHQPPQNVNIDCYQDGYYQKEIDLFSQWYWPARFGQLMTQQQLAEYNDIWESIFSSLPTPETNLVLRDYHVDNLMLLNNRDGVAACGLLDFQDALMGSTAYDLVSLFEDARRDVRPGHDRKAAHALLRIDMNKEQKHSFDQWYHVLGAHRHTKVAGIFVRLYVRDAKQGYLNFMPRVLTLLERSLQTREMAPLAHWLDDNHPGPISAPVSVDLAHVKSLISSNGS